MAGSLKQNYLFNITSEIVIIIAPLLLTPYLTRTLGSEGLGEYAYYFSFASYFVLFSMLGLPNYGRRIIAKTRDDESKLSRVFCELYSFQICTSIVVTIIYCCFVHFFLHDYYISWIFAVYVASSIFDIKWLFFGMEQFKTTVIRNILMKLFSVILSFLFVKRTVDVWVYSLITATGFLGANLLLFLKVKKLTGAAFHFCWSWKEHIKPVLVLFIPEIAVSIYKVMDKVMLGLMTNLNEVGFYESSEKVIKVPMAFITALGAVMVPRISNLLVNKEEEKTNLYLHKTMVYSIFLNSVMCFGIIAVADVFCPLFFGSGFERCIDLFAVLLPSCIFLAFASVIRTQLILPHEMDKQLSVILLIGSAVNLALNIVLIPLFQSVGAAAATLTTEAVVCILHCYLVREKIQIIPLINNSVPFVFAGGIMVLVVRSLNIHVSNDYSLLLIKVLLGAITYIIVLVSVCILSNKRYLLSELYAVLYTLKKGEEKNGHN